MPSPDFADRQGSIRGRKADRVAPLSAIYAGRRIISQHFQKVLARLAFGQKFAITNLVAPFIIIGDPISSVCFQTVLLFLGIDPFDANGTPRHTQMMKRLREFSCVHWMAGSEI